MKCLACNHGTLVAGRTTVTVTRETTSITIRHVPADVCDTCGEYTLDAAVALDLETTVRQATRAGVRFEVRDYVAA